MSQPPAPVTAEELVAFVRDKAPELLAEATVDASFDEMDVDSLSLVEIAVMVSEKYKIRVEDWEIAEAGNFPALAGIIDKRRALEAAR